MKPRSKPDAAPPQWPADQVERWPLDKLVPYARNARTHSEAQTAQIAASIREWGWTVPVLVAEDGTIIAGHGRVLAARQLGIDTAPVMVARGWTEAQRRAYVLADNKLALNAGWDDALLAVEMGDLKEMGADLQMIGFSDDELKVVLEGWQPDFEKIDKVQADMRELGATIKVRCAQVDADEVQRVVEQALTESGIEGVTVER